MRFGVDAGILPQIITTIANDCSSIAPMQPLSCSCSLTKAKGGSPLGISWRGGWTMWRPLGRGFRM